MSLPRCRRCEGSCFVGVHQGNVIVSGEVTREICVVSVKTVQNYDLYNGPPLKLCFTEVNPLSVFYFG